MGRLYLIVQVADFLEVCEECDSRVYLDEVRGEYTCSDCGLVQTPVLLDDSKPFDKQGRPYASGQRFSWRDAGGKPVDPATVARYRIVTTRVVEGSEVRRKSEIHIRIHSAVARLGYPVAIADRAEFIFSSVRKKFRTNHDYLISASIYTAARILNMHVDIRSLAEQFFKIETTRDFITAKRKLLQYYKKICRASNLHPTLLQPANYIPSLASKLRVIGIESQIEEKAYEYVRDALIPNVSAKGIATAALYISALYFNMRLSIKEVAEIVSMSTLTLRKYAELLSLKINEPWAKIEPVESKDVETFLKKASKDEAVVIGKLLNETPGTGLYVCSSEECQSHQIHGESSGSGSAASCNIEALKKRLRTTISYGI